MAIIAGQPMDETLIHYVAYNGVHLVGLRINDMDEQKRCDLVIFTNMSNVNGVKNFGQQFQQDVKYSQAGEPGTWHYLKETTGAGLH